MEDLSIGDVVLATFPFSDLSSRKLRPCYIIGIAEFDDVVLCQITSRHYDSKRAISLKQTDFSSGSIVSDSYIRPDKIATLDHTTIKKTLGKVSLDKRTEVKQGLREFLEI